MNTSLTIRPQVLLLASRYDLTCDYVVSQLRRRAVRYLRLNSEDLCDSSIELDPVRRRLEIGVGGSRYTITPDDLRSVLFRRPVFLRDYGDSHRSPEDQFSRLQWAAFIRNLMLFHEARWINNPVATYRAEHKAVQLSVAAEIGFAIPETRVTNSPHPDLLGEGCGQVAMKGLDTVLLRSEGQEMFGFTTFGPAHSLAPAAWSIAPATIQKALTNKLDLRVTVVEEQVFTSSITVDGRPIPGDWRTQKTNATFSEYELPAAIAQRCSRLVSAMGLCFGAVDLALQDGEYYFLEINPTGEWAWLVDAARLPIDEAIADALAQEVPVDVG